MRSNPILSFLQLLCIVVLPVLSKAQELLRLTTINGTDSGINLPYTGLFKSSNELYFNTTRHGGNQLLFGDTILQGNRNDTLTVFNRRDVLIIKVDDNQNVKNLMVIDNCDSYDDHTTMDEQGVILVNMYNTIDADSLAVMTMPDGTEIRREDHLGQSLLILTDEDMNYIKHITPTTGKIRQIEGGTDAVYMAIEIPEYTDYILVGPDTVENIFHIPFPPSRSYVFARYDPVHEVFLWWKRAGSLYRDILWDMKMDSKENLISLIHPGGTLFFIGEEDTIAAGTGPDYNLVIKLDRDGNYIEGEAFEGLEGEFMTRLRLDKEDNLYVLGKMYGSYLTVYDTFLVASHYTADYGQGIVIKYDSAGGFQWIFHIPGVYNSTDFYDVTNGGEEEPIFLAGDVTLGTINLTGMEYTDTGEYHGAYIVRVNKEMGKDEGHVMLLQEALPRFYNVNIDSKGDLIAYLRMRGSVELLGNDLTSITGGFSGFLVTISSLWDSILSTQTLIPDLFTLYPNPVSGQEGLHIQMNDNYTFEEVTIQVIDMKGFIVQGFTTVSEPIIDLKLNELVSGLYMLLIREGDKYCVEKFVVK